MARSSHTDAARAANRASARAAGDQVPRPVLAPRAHVDGHAHQERLSGRDGFPAAAEQVSSIVERTYRKRGA
jgi:hypothetical protein